MKTIRILLLLATPFFIHVSMAQVSSSTFGLKGGLNISTLGGDSEGVSSKVGMHVGLFTLIKGTENFKIQPELIYSRQGASGDGGGNAKIKYNYLNVPIMMKLYPAEQGFNLQFGPQIGLLLSGRFTADNNIDVDVADQLNSVDFGLGLGVGYDVGDVILDARYNFGLNSTAEDDSDGTFPNRTFQLSLGLFFNK